MTLTVLAIQRTERTVACRVTTDGRMSEAPNNHEPARRLAILEERMNTKAVETESALDRLRADMAARETRRSCGL